MELAEMLSLIRTGSGEIGVCCMVYSDFQLDNALNSEYYLEFEGVKFKRGDRYYIQLETEIDLADDFRPLRIDGMIFENEPVNLDEFLSANDLGTGLDVITESWPRSQDLLKWFNDGKLVFLENIKEDRII